MTTPPTADAFTPGGDSATRRLFVVLADARKRNRSEAVRKVWADILDLPARDTAAVLNGVATLIRLTGDAKAEVQALPHVDHAIYLKPFASIEEGFAQANLETPFESFARFMDEPTMVALQFCVDSVSRLSTMSLIPADELKQLHSEASDLLESLLKSSVPEELRALLAEHLHLFLSAINSYRITGADGLERALQVALGGFVVRNQTIKIALEHPDSKSTVTSFFKIVERLSTLLAAAGHMKELGVPLLRKLLGPGFTE